MKMKDLENYSKEIALRNGFEMSELIYSGNYYSRDHIRNLIYTGVFQGKPAVLKVYDDPRLTDEPVSLREFNLRNKSKRLIAPELYAYEVATPQKGWLIMEKLPEGGKFYNVPLRQEDRKEFLALYSEYRRFFPSAPTRKKVLAEDLPTEEYHIFRISRWLNLAMEKEEEAIAKGQNSALNSEEFIPRYLKALGAIRKVFPGRKMVWCHGHFKPQEIYKTKEGDRFYLTDFAHTKMYPEGYELAFIIWADTIMTSDWNLDYNAWKQGIFSWAKSLVHFGGDWWHGPATCAQRLFLKK